MAQEDEPETPASRAGVLESEYRAWASGAKVAEATRQAILRVAPDEPAFRVKLDDKGNPNGLEQFTPVYKSKNASREA